MRIRPNILTLDIKVQDKFRERLAQLADGNLKIKCVMLGDSDIDYDISQDMNNARILNAPFNTEGVKYPLVFEGSEKGLDGYITCFARKVLIDPSDPSQTKVVVASNYQGPSDDTFYVGQLPPGLVTGIDRNNITFTGDKMGYILYFQTILLNYYDTATQLNRRLNEEINMEVSFKGSTVVPPKWEVVKDKSKHNYLDPKTGLIYKVWNNSLLIAKDAGSNQGNNIDGLIKVSGVDSNISKYITFNYNI